MMKNDKNTLDNKTLSFKIHVIFMETLSIFSPKVCPLCIQELIVHNVAKSYLKLHLKFYAPIFSTFLFVKLKSMSDNRIEKGI